MNIENYLIFLTASFILWVTPGQDTIYIIARSLSQGRAAGVVSVLGIGTGALFHAGLAIAGVSLVLLASPVLFLTVKVLGGGFLVYLGFRMLLASSKQEQKLEPPKSKLLNIYVQGVITNVLNPKVAIFFIAFLPQFVTLNNAAYQLVVFGLTFVVGGVAWCLLVVIFASKVSSSVITNSFFISLIKKISGVTYLGLGINVLRAKA
ncbi:MAG: LysE family translocator [Agarilytica sp.]